VEHGLAGFHVEHCSSDVEQVLAAGLGELGLPDEAAPRLATLAKLLAQWAARLNLTAHRTAEAIARRLILDAIALSQVLPGQPVASLADIGSGAGFPGLPIAIVWPSCSVTLVEARERRHHFHRTAIRALELRNVVPIHGRAEIVPASMHRVVVAQAAADPAIALSWMRRWVEPGGWLVIPRSHHPEPFDPPNPVVHVQTATYRVPGTGPERTAWLGQLSQPAGASDLPDTRPL